MLKRYWRQLNLLLFLNSIMKKEAKSLKTLFQCVNFSLSVTFRILERRPKNKYKNDQKTTFLYKIISYFNRRFKGILGILVCFEVFFDQYLYWPYPLALFYLFSSSRYGHINCPKDHIKPARSVNKKHNKNIPKSKGTVRKNNTNKTDKIINHRTIGRS